MSVLSSWIVTMDIRYDDQQEMTIRYGDIVCVDRDTALVRAGQRLARKLQGAIVTSASVEKESKARLSQGRIIDQ